MKSKLSHREQSQNDLGERNTSLCGGGGREVLSFFPLSETAIFGKEHKIKVFFREGTAGMEAVHGPL